jgi:hypothetical protein
MSDDDTVLVPSYEYAAGPGRGLLSPFDPGTRTLPAGYRIHPRFRPIPTDIVLDKDVAVPMRDGVTSYVDVFRPAGTEQVPVIVAWSPYGKSGGTAPSTVAIFDLVGLDHGVVSGLEKFEGPDPAYWVAQGYAVCNPDPRGIGESDGDSAMFGRQEGKDCHDLIEWLAAQEWCNGRVAMSGTSYLAIAQWFTAAEQPPHLAAINPWEGFSDVYRDLVLRGGMPDLGFTRQLQHNFAGRGRREDVAAVAERDPLMNDLWEDKVARLDQVTVPAYVVASYTNTLHAAGTFRAWRMITSPDKWLRIHASQEWPDYYDDANVEDLRRFFDHYLKGRDNGWETTPPVRYALLDLEGGDRDGRPAGQFPPDEVADTRYYLDGRTRTLSAAAAPAEDAAASYDAATLPGQVSFTVRFDQETTLVGYPKAHLWVETEGADDADLFVLVQKLTAGGIPLQEFTTPARGPMIQDATERTGSVLRYKGSPGRLRVSARHLDKTLSTDAVPEHTFDRVEKLAPGEVVDVEIALFPVGLVFRPGQQLRLVISARNPLGAIIPGVPFYDGQTEGRVIVHTGGAQASYLQLPVMAA